MFKVRFITSYTAPGKGHLYTLTHHYPDGTTRQETKELTKVTARVGQYTIHLKGAEAVTTDAKTAQNALAEGWFTV